MIHTRFIKEVNTHGPAQQPVELNGRPSPLYWFMGEVTAIMLFVSVRSAN